MIERERERERERPKTKEGASERRQIVKMERDEVKEIKKIVMMGCVEKDDKKRVSLKDIEERIKRE